MGIHVSSSLIGVFPGSFFCTFGQWWPLLGGARYSFQKCDSNPIESLKLGVRRPRALASKPCLSLFLVTNRWRFAISSMRPKINQSGNGSQNFLANAVFALGGHLLGASRAARSGLNVDESTTTEAAE
jgi:hypothetical protein